jgi:hypothetical protein
VMPIQLWKRRLCPILPYASSRKLPAQFWFQNLYCDDVANKRHSLICKCHTGPVMGPTGRKYCFESFHCHWKRIFINCQTYGTSWCSSVHFQRQDWWGPWTAQSPTQAERLFQVHVTISLWTPLTFQELAFSIFFFAFFWDRVLYVT